MGSDEEKKAYERIEARLDRLEQSLQRIEDHLVGDPEAADGKNVGGATASAPGTEGSQTLDDGGSDGGVSEDEASASTDENIEDNRGATRSELDVETWLNRLGIGLLLFGLVFLYRLSEEMGLLTDPVRVGLGVGLGAGLGAVGWRVRTERRRLSQILFGGSIAAFYISVYAAYQLYEILPNMVAFGAMCAVTMAAFVLAHRWREISLSVIGAVGGFVTPFALSSGEGNIVALCLYNGLLVAGMTAIYLDRGWRHLLALTALGGWMVVALATVVHLDAGRELATATVVTGNIAVVWVAVGVAPIIRGWMVGEERFSKGLVASLVVVSPTLAVLLTRPLWDPAGWVWAVMYGLAAAVYAAGAHGLSRRFDGSVVAMHRLMVVGFVALALVQTFSGSLLAAAFAVLMVAVHFAARRLKDSILGSAGHVLTVGLTGWLVIVVAEWMGGEVGALFGEDAISTLVVIAAFFVASWAFEHKRTRVLYRYLSHGLVLAYIFCHGTPRVHGDYLVSGLWAGVASAILVAGMIVHSRHVQRVGLATVVFTVGKLIIYDMHGTETIWRVGVFVGIGVLLLAISYLSPTLRGDVEH